MNRKQEHEQIERKRKELADLEAAHRARVAEECCEHHHGCCRPPVIYWPATVTYPYTFTSSGTARYTYIYTTPDA